jgi:hypothetical protein
MSQPQHVSETMGDRLAQRWLVPLSVQPAPTSPATFGWTAGEAGGLTPQAAFRPLLSDNQTAVAIVRAVEVGERVEAELVAWSGDYGTSEEARLRYEWLLSNPAICTRLGMFAAQFGPEEVTAEIEVAAAQERGRLEMQKERENRQAEEARRRAEAEEKEAKKIYSYDRMHNRLYGWALERGNADTPFLIMTFREKWERERFKDWARYQKHQYNDWATALETCSAIELERLLISQMMEAERREKALGAAGLADRGRRPLRFWRGEA